MSAPSTSSVPPAAAKDIPATKLSPILADEVDEPLLLAAYTLSLTAEHVLDNNAKNPLLSFYSFTQSLELDIQEALSENIGVHALFLCGLGSMKSSEHLDNSMKARCEFAQNCSVPPPADHAYCDKHVSVHGWLVALLTKIGYPELQVQCEPPYAAIWKHDELQCNNISWINNVTGSGNIERKAMLFHFDHLPSTLDFRVVLNQSPSSKDWDKLGSPQKRQAIKNLAEAAGATVNGKQQVRWFILGDLSTDEGTLRMVGGQYWDPSITKADDPLALCTAIHQARLLDNKKGDYILSQGIFSSHFQSSIGASNPNGTSASSTHNMVVMQGFFALPQDAQDRSQITNTVPPRAANTASSSEQISRQDARTDAQIPQMQSTTPTSAAPPRAGQILDAIGVAAANEENEAITKSAESALVALFPDARHALQVQASLEKLLEFRQLMVVQMAQHNHGSFGYSAQEWQDWWEHHEFSHSQMTWVLDQWRNHFVQTEMHTTTANEVRELMAKGTRASKAEAREKIRRAFRAMQKHEYGNPTLAKCFLKYPALALDEFLADWDMYQQTDEYKDARDRSSREKSEDVRTYERQLKLHCRKLRKQLREAHNLERLGAHARQGKRASRLWEYYTSGALQNDLQQATREHGFGRLRGPNDTSTDLQQLSFMDFRDRFPFV